MQPRTIGACLLATALAGCATGGGGGDVSAPHRPAVAVADEVTTVNRAQLLGSWTCRELNPFQGRPPQSQTTTYTADGKARSQALVDLAQQGAAFGGKMMVEYNYDWRAEGGQLVVSNPQSSVRAVDGSAATGMMAGIAQLVSRTFVERSMPGTVEVLKLNAGELVVRAVGVEEPPVIACTRA